MSVCVSPKLPLVQHAEHSLLSIGSCMRCMFVESFTLSGSSYAPRWACLGGMSAVTEQDHDSQGCTSANTGKALSRAGRGRLLWAAACRQLCLWRQE